MDDRITPASLRARFLELGNERNAVLAVSTPLRDERDAISATAAEQIDALQDQISAAEAGLFDIDQERAMIARALGGRTGDPEGTE